MLRTDSTIIFISAHYWNSRRLCLFKIIIKTPGSPQSKSKRLTTMLNVALSTNNVKSYKYETIISIPGFSFLNLFLYFILRGLNLSLFPQQGHQTPGQVMNTEHVWHRFWPRAYRLFHETFRALWRIQIPLHANRVWILVKLYLKYSVLPWLKMEI